MTNFNRKHRQPPKVAGLFCSTMTRVPSCVYRLYSLAKFLTSVLGICLLFYVVPPYKMKAIFEDMWSAVTTFGSVASSVLTQEEHAKVFAQKTLKSGRDLWQKFSLQASDDIQKVAREAGAMPIIELSG